MPKRPRMLDPDSLWASEKIAATTDREFRLWIYLLTNADDDGRGDYFPGLLAVAPFMAAPITPEEATAALSHLKALGLVVLYGNGAKKLYQITRWSAHQRIRSSIYTPSLHPAPDGFAEPSMDAATTDRAKIAHGSRMDRAYIAHTSRTNQGKNELSKGAREDARRGLEGGPRASSRRRGESGGSDAAIQGDGAGNPGLEKLGEVINKAAEKARRKGGS